MSGIYGNIPAPIYNPNPAGDLSAQIPGLAGLNKAASGNIQSELMGQLSPDTLQTLRNAAASQAQMSGMPGTNVLSGTFGGNQALAAIGLTSQQLKQQGLADYSRFVPTVSSTQTLNPAIQTEIATQNSLNQAAPDPAAAQTYAQQLFDKYLKQMNQTPAQKMGLKNNATYYTMPGSNVYKLGYPI